MLNNLYQSKKYLTIILLILFFSYLRFLFLEADITFLYGVGWAIDETFYYCNAINKLKYNHWIINPEDPDDSNERFITSFFYIYINYIFAKIFGISLFSFRLVSYIFSLIFSLLFYLFIRNHFGNTASLWSLLLLNISNTFLSISRMVRPEILLLLLLILCLILIYKNKFIYFSLAGALFAFTVFYVKANAFIFFIIFVLYFITINKNNKLNLKALFNFFLYFFIGTIPLSLLYGFFIRKYYLVFKTLVPAISFENNFSAINFLKEGFFLWKSTLFSLDPFLYSFSIGLVPLFLLNKNNFFKIASLWISFVISFLLFFRLGHEIIRNIFIFPFCIIICFYLLFKIDKEIWLNYLEKTKEKINSSLLIRILRDLILIYILSCWFLINYFSLNNFINSKKIAIALSSFIIIVFIFINKRESQKINYPLSIIIYFQIFLFILPLGNVLNWLNSLFIPSKHYKFIIIRYCSYSAIFIISLFLIPLINKTIFSIKKIKKFLAIGLSFSLIMGVFSQFIMREYTIPEFINYASSKIEDGAIIYGAASGLFLLAKDRNIYVLRNTHKESKKSYLAIYSPKDFPYEYRMDKYQLLWKKEIVCFGIKRKCLIDLMLYDFNKK